MDIDDKDEQSIAVIGVSGCFSGASNLEEYWSNVKNGVEAISFFSDEELLAAGIDQTTIQNPSYVKAKGILKDIEMFDASFFTISPQEAEIIDPQHRLFLEHSWEALEQAGYCVESYDGSIGVYVGLSSNTYLLSNLRGNEEKVGPLYSHTIAIGNRSDFAASRVSYKLHLKGPAVSVQCACSSSLVAVHLACQSLWQGECDIVLAGGASITIPQVSGMIYNDYGMISPDGHCRTFDEKSQGTVSGSGVGVIVLKLLTDAIEDGDTIHAVIKGSAVNNDSSSKIGYTAPGVEGQARVIIEAQAVAGVEPATISYIEAHGTGTKLGDPIEVAALTKAFRRSTTAKNFCAIGSVKPNIGHLDAASGMAGLIKTILALKYKQLPGLLHFEMPNPEIDFTNSPFYINDKLIDWPANAGPRRAGVSSFGTGGTNAHIILEEAPTIKVSGPSRSYQLIMLSAKTDTALEKATTNLAAYLQRYPAFNVADVAYTLQVGRETFPHRSVTICQNGDLVYTSLEESKTRTTFSGTVRQAKPIITFLFPSQEAQYENMGLELYQHEALFRSVVDLCAEILKPHLEWDLRNVLYPHQSGARTHEDNVNKQRFILPVLFTIEYALAQLWISWGIHPHALLGYGVGEYVAACIAGIFSLEEGLALAANGKLSRQLRLNHPQIAICSSVTGTWLKPAEASDPLYWEQLLHNAPNLTTAMRIVLQSSEQILLEVGPGQTLSNLAHTQSGPHSLPLILTSMQSVTTQSESESLLTALGQLWLQGVAVNWSEFYTDEYRHRLPLPTYPFERQRYWIDPAQ